VLYRLSYLGKKADPEAGHVERAMRFELTTFSLARRRSTAELRPHTLPASILQLIHFSKIRLRLVNSQSKFLLADIAFWSGLKGGPGRIRTDDLLLAKETPSR
jgi:hypothetical protein